MKPPSPSSVVSLPNHGPGSKERCIGKSWLISCLLLPLVRLKLYEDLGVKATLYTLLECSGARSCNHTFHKTREVASIKKLAIFRGMHSAWRKEHSENIVRRKA